LDRNLPDEKPENKENQVSPSAWKRWLLRFAKCSGQHHRRQARPVDHPSLFLEYLESRDLFAVGMFHPTFVLRHPTKCSGPFLGLGPVGTTPAQIRHAYGFDQLNFSGGTISANGAGTTIAIVDAFDAPNIASDLHQFDLQFNLPDPIFTKVNQTGGNSLPASNANWALEISLDVEWAHAIAPKANILLVEAASNNNTDLFAAASFAANQSGVVVVSMSFGSNEFSGESSSDNTFTTPAGHTGVTFVASSGDTGAPVSYPAVSPNVLSVGGTTLHLDSSGNVTSAGETGWSGSGGGISTQESQPSYQNGVVTQSTIWRTNPDVAYDADPNTGFPVYDTFRTSSAWQEVGGTSDAAPQWAALIAIADQGRILAGETPMDGRNQTLPMIYSMPASNFHDITSGTSTGSPHEPSGVGYDLVTGRGSPVVPPLVSSLIGNVATHITIAGQASTTAGAPASITVMALNQANNTVNSYLGTVHFASNDPLADLPADYTFVPADGGIHTFTATLKTTGNQTITVADTATGSVTGITNPITVVAPITILGVQFNDGSAQRSMVTSITVTFSRAVGTVDDGAFQIIAQAGGGDPTVIVSWNADRTAATLTFSGSLIVGGSLQDGKFSLLIDSTKIHDASGGLLDGNGDGLSGGNRAADTFFRLFGDSDGNGVVDNLDLFHFRQSFGLTSSDAGYKSYFDYDGSGVVDNLDLFRFRQRFGTTLA
jgi:hypothetical protein